MYQVTEVVKQLLTRNVIFTTHSSAWLWPVGLAHEGPGKAVTRIYHFLHFFLFIILLKLFIRFLFIILKYYLLFLNSKSFFLSLINI